MSIDSTPRRVLRLRRMASTSGSSSGWPTTAGVSAWPRSVTAPISQFPTCPVTRRKPRPFFRTPASTVAIRIERRDLRDEGFAPEPPDVDHRLAVFEEEAARQAPRLPLRNAEREAEVLADALERLAHERHREAVAEKRDAVEDRQRQPARTVVESPVHDAVRQPVGDPFPAAARRVLGGRRRAGFRRLPLPHRSDYIEARPLRCESAADTKRGGFRRLCFPRGSREPYATLRTAMCFGTPAPI